jgi:hypothetical protein
MRSDAQKVAELKYRQSEKGKARDVRHRQSEKGKITKAQYLQSEKGKIVNACGNARYNQTGKGKIACTLRNTRYDQSKKGKIRDARAKARRKQDLGYEPINNWFPGCNGHHIDKVNVLFIPEKLHKSISHRQSDPASMEVINAAAFEWFCTQEII